MPKPLPPRPKGYGKILDWLDQLRDWVIAIRPLASPDCDLHETPGGTLILPRTDGGGGSSAVELWPWKGTNSLYSGEGTPPADRPRRVRFLPGSVNAIIPSNMAEEFVCPASAVTYFWVKTTHDAAGNLLAVLIDSGTVVPDDDIGGPDSAPAHHYRPINQITCDAEKITSIHPLRKESLNVVPVVSDRDCDSVTVSLQWT